MRLTLCIHPSQVAAVNASFAPSERELDWAHRVIAAASVQLAVVVDGKLVDSGCSQPLSSSGAHIASNVVQCGWRSSF